MENGKVEVSSGTVALLSAALDKPITYFYPIILYRELQPEKFSPLEQELLSLFQNIWSDHLRKVAIDQNRALSNFDPIEMIEDKWIEINEIRVQREEIDRAIKNKQKRTHLAE